MEIFLGVFILILAITGMSIGVIFNRKPLSGSCGGLSSEGSCSICGNDPNKWEDVKKIAKKSVEMRIKLWSHINNLIKCQ